MGLNDPAARSAYTEASYVRGSMDLSVILDTLGLRRCAGCGSAVPKDGPDHSLEECAVAEVMES